MSTGRRDRTDRTAARRTILAGAAAALGGACAVAPRPASAPAPAAPAVATAPAAPPTPDTSLLVLSATPTQRRDTAPAAASPAPQPPALDTAPPPLDPTDASGRVRWVGREADRTLSTADRQLLRGVFGVDDVRRIYLPTTASSDVLRYAAHAPGCPDVGRPTTRGGACRVVGVRIGLAAPRDSTETWDAFTARVERGGPRVWSASGGRSAYTSLEALDPDARPAFERLIEDARSAGFPIHVRETYRTPERQAAILSRNDGRTTTLTSAHSYGRAVDISVGGRRQNWVEFRRWVLRQQNGAFRLIGTPESTWDWPHVEYVGASTGAPLGYRTMPELLAAARACREGAASDAEAAERCTKASPRPAETVAVTTVSDEAPARPRGGRRGRHVSRRSHAGSRGSSRSARSRGKASREGRSHGAKSHGGGSHGSTAHPHKRRH